MNKPHLRLKVGGSVADAVNVPRVGAESYTAGSLTHPDMRRWYPGHGSADADLIPELRTIRSRTRDIERNHGVAAGAAQTNVDNIVGTGLRMKCRPDWKMLAEHDKRWTEQYAEEWSNKVEARWTAYKNSCWFDAGRQLHFDEATALVFHSTFSNGGVGALPLALPETGAIAATCFQLIEIDRLNNPNHQPDREDLRGGVHLNAYGAPLGYWILKSHPGDSTYGSTVFNSDAEYVPAFTPWGRKRFIHLYRAERIGQNRGAPSLAAVLRQFKVLGDYSNAELKAAVVNAMIALVTKSNLSQDAIAELLSTDGDARKQYADALSQRNSSSIPFNQGGAVIPLALGEDIAGFTPARPVTAFEPFTLALFRQIAAGLNLPYELLLKDFSKSNYSSARAALLEAWRFFRGRRKWLATYWAQPVFELWLEEEVMEERIEAPDFYALRPWYCRTKWGGDGRGWIDPLKEAQAANRRLSDGITNLDDECAEQGEDWEERMEQRAREMKRAKSLGVSYEWMFPGEVTHSNQLDPEAGLNQTGDFEPDPEDPEARGGQEGEGGEENGGAEPGEEKARARRAAPRRADGGRINGVQINPELLELAKQMASRPVNHYVGRPAQAWKFETDDQGNTTARPIEEGPAS